MSEPKMSEADIAALWEFIVDRDKRFTLPEDPERVRSLAQTWREALRWETLDRAKRYAERHMLGDSTETIRLQHLVRIARYEREQWLLAHPKSPVPWSEGE